jgi:bifunctional DNA-binding transcriptional regulator/antitoxin component of YhaV-PrlF toxin-antitoxin module
VAIYRTLYYGDVTVGTGGRLTIPLGIRSDCGIRKGDTLTVRVEETPRGTRQLVMWRNNPEPDD